MRGLLTIFLVGVSFFLGMLAANAFGAGEVLSVAELEVHSTTIFTTVPANIDSFTTGVQRDRPPRKIGASIQLSNADALLDSFPNKPEEITTDPQERYRRRGETLLAKGIERLAAGDYTGAVGTFDSAIAWNPDLTEAYFYRAMAHVGSGNPTLAEQGFSEVLTHDPENWPAYYNRGCVRLSRKKYKAAIEDFTRNIAGRPQHAESYCNRGNCYLNLGHRQRAIEDYLSAIDIRPKDYALPFNNIGAALLERGASEGGDRRTRTLSLAMHWFEQAVRIRPDWQLPWLNRAVTLGKLGQYRLALECADRAVELLPGEAGGYVQRAMLRQQSGDLDGAGADIDRAIVLAPQRLVYFTYRARVLQQQGKYDQAVSDLEQYLRKNPYDLDVRLQYKRLLGASSASVHRPNERSLAAE